MADRVGQQLGNYKLISLLGQGGFADVYLGEHLHLGTQAAIKVLAARLVSEQNQSFLHEARTIAHLEHPHIVRVLDYGVESELPYLVMQYAPGGTLRQRHSRGTQLSLATVVSYVKQLASALQYAHDANVIHRDIKPENMLLGRNHEVLLGDFGLAALAHSSRSHLTQAGYDTAGALVYMSPEQLNGHPTYASDQYALGVMVYEWLSGAPPFSGSFPEVALKHRQVAPASLCEQVPALPPALEQTVFKALAKDPQHRFASVQAFALALEAASRSAAESRRADESDHSAQERHKQSTLRHLPTGTVTLLFTDIEGSTHLLQQLGDHYADLLKAYRSLLRTAFERWNGHEVDTQGDALFTVFARATDAVSAAVDAQRALASHSWPEDKAVRARMGLHTGQPSLTAQGYVGLDVHRAARIMSAGHGGQVLLSQTPCILVEHELADDVSLRDLGEYHLKDLGRPIRLFQLVISDLPADFPPLKTLDAHPNNLPVQSTLFIGREQEVATVQHLLGREEVRLLTLTGPGGIGKTRLGLQVAAELSDQFSDGVYFVNLAPLSDPALVIPMIAQTLNLKETGDQPLLDGLKGFLRGKQLLLLLDNFEHVIAAAVQIAELLAACPRLKVMVTSRAVLHLTGEQECAVPPLPLPDPRRLPDLDALSHYAAVMLFIQRAQAVKPDFRLTNANASAVVEICARLDGLPLAIELAAARVKLLPPHALLGRLGQRFAVLTSGAPDVPARQQTLRNTIAWSYHLLDASEQQLFRRLSVFVGGCTLEAVEAMCEAREDEKEKVFDGVASLLDKSLLQQTEQEGGEPRLTKLETVREYGLECLRESGEAHESQRAHAHYYLALAEEAEPHLKGEKQVLWWKQLEREQENLRAALAWLIGQEEGELALRFSGALWWFWNIRGYWSEGWRWLKATLGLPQAQARTASRAKALIGAAEFTAEKDIFHSLLEESVAIYRELGDKRGLAEALGGLGWSWIRQNNVAAARISLEESLALAREVGDPWVLAYALQALGHFMDHYQGDFKRARPFLEESLTLFQALNDKQMLSRTLLNLVYAVLSEGQVTQAAALAQENLALARELDNRPHIILALTSLAVTKVYQGEAEQAVALLEENIVLAREHGFMLQIGFPQFILGGIVLYQGDLLRAETCAQESLATYRELRSKSGTAGALSLLGDIRRIQGDLIQARADCTESVLLAHEAGNHYYMGSALISLAKVAAAEGQSEQAAHLFGSAEPWLNPSLDLDPYERADYEHAVESVRMQLGEEAFASAWAEGGTLTPEQALALQEQALVPTAISATVPSSPAIKSKATYPDELTAREVDVLRLVAQGLSNMQVAEQLVISPRTVDKHLTSIYSKIGVTSRSAATRYAMEHRLV